MRPATRASSVVAHALFTKSVSNGLTALTIDVASGNVTSKADVTGPASDYYDLYYGESTRVWPFDASKARFVFADFDFSENQRLGGAQGVHHRREDGRVDEGDGDGRLQRLLPSSEWPGTRPRGRSPSA